MYAEVFISFRFSEAMQTAHELKQSLSDQHGVEAFVCDVPVGGGDILDEIVSAIDVAKVFVVLGTRSYGRQTSSLFATRQELVYAMENKKSIFLVKMCESFDEPIARFLLPLSIPYYPHFPDGSGVPLSLTRQIAEAVFAVRTEIHSSGCLISNPITDTDNKQIAAQMASPVNSTIFSDLYAKFGAAMTAAMTSEGDHPAAPDRQTGESASAYSLRVAREHYQPHHWVNDSSVFARFRLARQAGRAFVDYGLDLSVLSDRQKAELSNAYVFCAPLDAINWARMKDMPIDLSSWAGLLPSMHTQRTRWTLSTSACARRRPSIRIASRTSWRRGFNENKHHSSVEEEINNSFLNVSYVILSHAYREVKIARHRAYGGCPRAWLGGIVESTGLVKLCNRKRIDS